MLHVINGLDSVCLNGRLAIRLVKYTVKLNLNNDNPESGVRQSSLFVDLCCSSIFVDLCCSSMLNVGMFNVRSFVC